MPSTTTRRIRAATLALAALVACAGAVRAERPMADPAFAAAETGPRRGGRPVQVPADFAPTSVAVTFEPVQTARGTRMRPVAAETGVADRVTEAAVLRPMLTARGTRLRPDAAGASAAAAVVALN
jgi:hypothetical protein